MIAFKIAALVGPLGYGFIVLGLKQEPRDGSRNPAQNQSLMGNVQLPPRSGALGADWLRAHLE